MPRFELIGFDGDDTLWHNERLFVDAQARFKEILAPYLPVTGIEDRLYETEMRNLPHFGYGIKGFTLSMIETAVELTAGRITGTDVKAILDAARAMMAAEVELLPGAATTVQDLAARHQLVLITKGDLHDQERKIEHSGLARYFRGLEIVSDKKPATYARVMAKHGVTAERFLMVGNSMRSDILPVLSLGGSAVWVPAQFTWSHEVAQPPQGRPNFHEIASLAELAELLEKIEHHA